MRPRKTLGPLLVFMVAGSASRAGEVGRPMTNEPQAPPADLLVAARANQAFALDCYARLRPRPGNLFFSPASLATALSMAAIGARGETAAQMQAALHLPRDPHQAAEVGSALLRSLQQLGQREGSRLRLANAIWGQRGAPVLAVFQQTLDRLFGARMRELDFRGETEAARRTINDWAEAETGGKIRDLLPPGVIGPSTRMILTNAIHFKGTWTRPFAKEQTRGEDFHLSPDRTARVPMMHRTGHYAYMENPQLQALELPYAGDELAMVILLPRAVDGLGALESSCTTESLSGWIAGLQPREVVVSVPRFQLTAEFELSKPLAALGMVLAFGDRADFSGINGGSESLQLSAVVHKAFVDVNEEGTEAAAATGIAVGVTSAAIPTPRPVFRADHPFLLLIRDRRSGTLLFLGRLSQP